MYMFAREVSSLEAGKQVAGYWSGYSKEEIFSGFDRTMPKVKRRKVPSWDAVSEPKSEGRRAKKP